MGLRVVEKRSSLGGSDIEPDLSFVEDLNPEQREGATYTGGPLLILAGAGSGKTRCLTYRFAYLVRRFDLTPDRVLAITFTNKAAREMRGRVERLLGLPPSTHFGGPLWVSTFHSTSARLLRRYGEEVGLGPNFAIYDMDDQLALMKQIVAQENWDETRWPPGGFLAAIGRAKDELLGPDDLAASSDDLRQERTARAYSLYQDLLRRNNAVDFDDLICKTVLLLRKAPKVLAELRGRFLHVLVDEYQDTNHAQYVLTDLLAAGHRNLCVVGDDDQSIYRWRGADIRNVLEFEQDYPDAKVIRLERNYRSTSTILAAANGVISHNGRRKDKTLWTSNDAGDPVIYYLAEDEREEAEFVAGEILGARNSQGLPLRSFAILYRTHAQSRVFEEVLVRKAVPYQIIGGVRFYERKEIKDVLAYLRVVHNPADEVSLARALSVPRRGLGPQTMIKLRELAETPAGGDASSSRPARLGLFEAIRLATTAEAGSAGSAGIGPKLRGELGRFVDLIDRLAAQALITPVADMVREVAEKSGMLDALRREETLEAGSRIENIKELATVAAEAVQDPDSSPLAGFLETAALLAAVDVMKDGDDGVTLMSAHNAKGLEFPFVFLVGLEQGLLPHSKSLEEEGGLEEERRLSYVAMTRAMKRLYLTHARQRTRYGFLQPAEASIFLAEIPKEILFVASLTADPCVAQSERGGRAPASPAALGGRPARFGPAAPGGRPARLDPAAPGGRPARFGPAASGGPADGAMNVGPRLSPGERVIHPRWGEGVIVGLSRVGARLGYAGDLQLRVAFAGQGLKTIPATEVTRRAK
jgi:DNA helicase-2/ATP-dependent DNA helicase PcrA